MTGRPASEAARDEVAGRFEAGEDVADEFDLDEAVVERPEPNDTRVVNVTLPVWLIAELDAEAQRRGIPRKSVINDWLVDRADRNRSGRAA